MVHRLSDEEVKRRKEALANSTTVREAAEKVDLTTGAMADWGRRHWESYKDKFAKGSHIGEDEYNRRIEALENSNSVTEAAKKIGMSVGGLADWARRQWEPYDEKFGHIVARHPRSTALNQYKRFMLNALTSARHEFEAIKEKVGDRVLQRAAERGISDIDYAIAYLDPPKSQPDETDEEEGDWTSNVIVKEEEG